MIFIAKKQQRILTKEDIRTIHRIKIQSETILFKNKNDS